MARVKADEAGTLVWDVLDQHPGGVNRKMLCEYSGLSNSQVARGLDWIRDLFIEEWPEIRVWRGNEWIYALGYVERDVREHAERRLRAQITRARRDHNFWHRVASKHASLENRHQEEMARRRLVDLQYAYDNQFDAAMAA